MPNWAYNTIAVKGKKKDVIDFFNKGLKVNLLAESMKTQEILDKLNALGGVGEKLTLRSWMPMPQTFVDYDTTNALPTIEGWLYSVFRPSPHFAELCELLGVTDDKYPEEKDKNARLHELIYRADDEVKKNMMKLIHERFDTRYKEFVKNFKAAIKYQRKEYGAVGWYDYNLQTLGTKWDSDLEGFGSINSQTGDDLIITFNCDTAWSTPDAWLQSIQEEFPELTIVAYSYEESGQWCGYFDAKDCEFIENDEHALDYDDETCELLNEDACDKIHEKFVNYVANL